MKKISGLLFVSILFSLFCFNGVSAKTVVDTGSCGAKVTYTLYSDGELFVEGSGKVRQFSCDGDVVSVTFGEGITGIANYVFSNFETLESVSFPQSLASIGDSCFYKCGLKEVFITKNITSFGSLAFAECPRLEEINVDNDNNSFSSENGVLFDKDKTTLVMFPAGKKGSYSIPNGVKFIGEFAFASSSLDSVIISESVNTIGMGSFNNADCLSSIIIPENVTEISGKAFENCSVLKTAVINGATIGDFAFYYCQDLEEVYLNDKITSIGSYAFSECINLKGVIIPEGVSEIPPYAFYNCDSLGAIQLHEKITTLGEYAFSNCNNLIDVVIKNKALSIGEKAFGFDDNNRLRNTKVYGIVGSTAETYSHRTFAFIDIESDSFLIINNEISLENSFILGVKEKINLKEFKTYFANKEFTVNGLGTSECIVTGTVVAVPNGETATVVIKGDTDGDGIISSTDFLRVKKAFLKEYVLENAYFEAADGDNDNLLTSTDYIKIKNYFLHS